MLLLEVEAILNDEVAEAAVAVEEVEIGGRTALRSILEGENIDPAAITTAAAASAAVEIRSS